MMIILMEQREHFQLTKREIAKAHTVGIILESGKIKLLKCWEDRPEKEITPEEFTKRFIDNGRG